MVNYQSPFVTQKKIPSRHWRLLEIKRCLEKKGIKCSYLSQSQIHVESIQDRKGFVIQIEVTDLPQLGFEIDHFKIWSMQFEYKFDLLAMPLEMFLKKLVDFSILKPYEIHEK